MPTYVYVTVKPDGTDGDSFEITQRMADAPLTSHPETRAPVRRVVQAPNLSLNWSDASSKSKLSNANLSRLGFTKYEKAGDGKYEKSAGDGPSMISAD